MKNSKVKIIKSGNAIRFFLGATLLCLSQLAPAWMTLQDVINGHGYGDCDILDMSLLMNDAQGCINNDSLLGCDLFPHYFDCRGPAIRRCESAAQATLSFCESNTYSWAATEVNWCRLYIIQSSVDVCIASVNYEVQSVLAQCRIAYEFDRRDCQSVQY